MRHHHYTLRDACLFLKLLLQGRASLRGAGEVPAIVEEVCGMSLGQPHWTTGRMWLLRLGLYKLHRPKVQADDWVWLVDHSVQVGATKCLLVLGVRQSELPPPGEPLRHEHLEPIELVPVENSTKQTVYEQLEAAAKKTGVPRAILNDHGSDLSGGVTLFRQQHPETLEIYDLAHKAARLLQRLLERDPRWTAFSARANQAKRQVQQTDLACLAPPPQGPKARFMNLAPLIRWGMQTLRLLERPADLPPQVPTEHLEDKLGWLREFRPELTRWSEFQEVIDTGLDYVRSDGLTHDSGAALREMLDALHLSPPARTLATQLAAFVRDEAAQLAPGERLPGTTEVLESCFGKQKALEQQQSRSGFTSLILGLPAFVSQTTAEVVEQAMATIRTKDVWAWCRDVLGPSVQTMRKAAYHIPLLPETNPG